MTYADKLERYAIEKFDDDNRMLVDTNGFAWVAHVKRVAESYCQHVEPITVSAETIHEVANVLSGRYLRQKYVSEAYEAVLRHAITRKSE